MYHLFGIVDRSGHRHDQDHRQSIAAMRTKFPARSAGFSLSRHPGLSLFGTHLRSCRKGSTELFFTGEIYNQAEILKRVPTAATMEEAILELILQQGESVISTINGGFVMILFDHESGRCRLINDQMGTLQLFFHAGPDFLVFATELKYLFCHPRCPRQIDWTASLKRPIPFLIVNAERHQDAWFKDIHLLEEGSVLDLQQTSAPTIRQYWNPWQKVSHIYPGTGSVNHQIDHYSEAYMDLLEDAVRIRCASPGRGYSMFSGGMDSTVIAALALKYGDVDTFSFATPATVRDGATDMCLRLAGDLGMNNMQVLVPFEDLVTDGRLWNRHIWSMESPFAHKDAIGKLALHAAISAIRPDVQYLLSGTGSDQLNGGLVRWFVEDAEEGSHDANWDRVMREIRTEMHKPLIGHQYDSFWGSRDLLRHDYLSSLSANPLNEYPWPEFVRGCLHANQFVLVWDELRSGAWCDRAVRFPFMDHRFVPFILSVPREYHSRLFFDKQILRQGSRSLLPSYLTDRPKAPVLKPGEDLRMNMYKEILLGQNGIMEELLDTMKNVDIPVDPTLFEAKVRQLAEQPDQAGWTYLMHLAGLVSLSRLPDLDEHTMDMKDLVMPGVDVISSAAPSDIRSIRRKMGVMAPEETWNLSLQFAPECSLVTDVFSQAHFLVRDGDMVYQLDEDCPDWQRFLRSIDGVRNASAICAEEKIDLDAIRDFLRISLEEGILFTLKTPVHHASV